MARRVASDAMVLPVRGINNTSILMNDIQQLLKEGTRAGIARGWTGFLWTIKIIIPISLATTLLEWSGVLGHIDFLLKPLMGLLSLPAMAAVPLLVGTLASIYGAIAAMAVLPLNASQMTLRISR